MFNIFQFFKKAKSDSSLETIESSLRKDSDPDIKSDGIYTINKVLDDSGLRSKVDGMRTLEFNMEKTRSQQDDKVIETKLDEAKFRSAVEDLQMPLVNVMSMNNDKKNNELFIEAMGEVNVNENIFKKEDLKGVRDSLLELVPKSGRNEKEMTKMLEDYFNKLI